MLGNGGTRPADLVCSFEAMCEGCAFFATTVEFKDRLLAQRDHVAKHGQSARQGLYEQLIEGLEEGAS